MGKSTGDRDVFHLTVSRTLTGKDAHVETAGAVAGIDWKLAGVRVLALLPFGFGLLGTVLGYAQIREARERMGIRIAQADIEEGESQARSAAYLGGAAALPLWLIGLAGIAAGRRGSGKDPVKYLHLKPDSKPPHVSSLRPFRTVLVAEEAVSPRWQQEISDWLVRSGCL